MPSDKIKITQKELDDIYEIEDVPTENKDEESVLTEEEQIQDDKFMEQFLEVED